MWSIHDLIVRLSELFQIVGYDNLLTGSQGSFVFVGQLVLIQSAFGCIKRLLFEAGPGKNP